MTDEELRAWVAQTLARLSTSGFRAGFTLSDKDRAYALSHGEEVIRKHARDLLATRVGSANPARDGRQTPFRGHPVFTAQHATATCCRGCIQKWHHIPRGRALTRDELDRLAELVIRWIRRDIVRHERAAATRDGEAPSRARADLDQHFLQNPEKIARLVSAAGVQPDDRVAELGAGVGSVAAHVPPTRELALVELDPALCARLRERFAARAEAHVVQADAIAMLRERPDLADVVISNLPAELTPRMLDALAAARFRVAVVAVRAGDDLSPWGGALSIEAVETLAGADFSPAQAFDSEVVRVSRRP